MGLDYHLHCEDCDANTDDVEYSVVGYVQLKHPDEAHQDLEHWTQFLVNHSGHRISFVDSRGKATNPSRITGGYVLGLQEYSP